MQDYIENDTGTKFIGLKIMGIRREEDARIDVTRHAFYGHGSDCVIFSAHDDPRANETEYLSNIIDLPLPAHAPSMIGGYLLRPAHKDFPDTGDPGCCWTFVTNNNLPNRFTPAEEQQPIAGYRKLKADEIMMINGIKAAERQIAELAKAMRGNAAFDQRWLAIAITDLQRGFMALTRAVAQPEDPFK